MPPESATQRLSYLEDPSQADPEEHENKEAELGETFSEFEKDNPGHFDANELLADFKKSSEEKERKESCRRSIRKMYGNPFYLETLYDRLEHLQGLDEENEKYINEIKITIDLLTSETIEKEQLGLGLHQKGKKEGVDNISERDLQTMDRWLELYANNNYRDRIGKLIGLSVTKAKTSRNYISRLYVLAYGVVRTSDPEIIKAGLTFLAREEENLPGDLTDIDRYIAATLEPDNDVTKMSFDTDAVFTAFASRYLPEGIRRFKEKSADLSDRLLKSGNVLDTRLHTGRLMQEVATAQLEGRIEDPRIQKIIALMKFNDQIGGVVIAGRSDENDPSRFDFSTVEEAPTPSGRVNVVGSEEDFENFIPAGATTRQREIAIKELRKKLLTMEEYPIILVTQESEMTNLRRDFSSRMAAVRTAENGAVYRAVYLPRQGESNLQIPSNLEQRRKIAQRGFNDEKAANKVIREDTIFELMALLFPNVTAEKRTNLVSRIVELKRQLREDIRQLISPRGDHIEIEDELLSRELGITSITFKPTTSVVDLDIIIRIGNVDCMLHIDDQCNLKRAETDPKKINRPLRVVPDTHLLIQELVYSHLQAILCKETVSVGSSTERGSGLEEKVVSRRAHLRRLPVGQRCSEQQIRLASEFCDLLAFNRSRGLTGETEETRQFTFVKAVEVEYIDEESKTQDPIRTRIKDASELKNVL